eukprot:628629-Prorocentrum_minimum.AAC.3
MASSSTLSSSRLLHRSEKSIICPQMRLPAARPRQVPRLVVHQHLAVHLGDDVVRQHRHLLVRRHPDQVPHRVQLAPLIEVHGVGLLAEHVPELQPVKGEEVEERHAHRVHQGGDDPDDHEQRVLHGVTHLGEVAAQPLLAVHLLAVEDGEHVHGHRRVREEEEDERHLQPALPDDVALVGWSAARGEAVGHAEQRQHRPRQHAPQRVRHVVVAVLHRAAEQRHLLRTDHDTKYGKVIGK